MLALSSLELVLIGDLDGPGSVEKVLVIQVVPLVVLVRGLLLLLQPILSIGLLELVSADFDRHILGI